MDKTMMLWGFLAVLLVVFGSYFQRWMKPEHKRERAVKLLASAYADEARVEAYAERLKDLRREHGVDRPVCRPDAFVEAEEVAR